MNSAAHPRPALLAVAAVLVLFAAPAAGQQAGAPPQDEDIVYVNSQEIIRQAPGANEAQQTWSRELEEYRAEVQALAAEVDSLRQELDSQRDMLNDEAVERREQEIQQKQQQLAQRAQQLEQRAAQRREELLGPILQEVGTVIEQIRAENGYDVVLDISSSGVRAAAPRLDITDLVLERLRQQSDAGGAASGGGSGS